MTRPDASAFHLRLKLALNTLNISPAMLGAAVGVDKSVTSRWLSGKVRPSAHNLATICRELARSCPGFSVAAFDMPETHFRRLLDLPELATPAGPEALLDHLPLPAGLLGVARRETARRGNEYFGHYTTYHPSFTQPGRAARLATVLLPEAGLIRLRHGHGSFGFDGWALLALNRLYLILVEDRYESMGFGITNATPQGRGLITGVWLGTASSELLIPAAAPICLAPQEELRGDTAADLARHAERSAVTAVCDWDEVPADVLRDLGRQSGLAPPGPGSDTVLRMPPSLQYAGTPRA